jgi:putative zinc finger protein/fervidolysin-like protein
VILRFFRFDDPVHRDAAELLPWLVNGTLDGGERERVESHLAQCVACRRELEAVRALQAAVASDERDPAVASALARLHARLDEEEAGYGPRRLVHMLMRRWQEARPTMRRTLAAQFALILVLAGALGIVVATSGPVPALYRTLGDTPTVMPGRPTIVVVFKGEHAEQEIRRLLLSLNARVVDGPSSVGAYRLELREGGQQEALALLRADPAVAFAEPMPAQGRRSE